MKRVLLIGFILAVCILAMPQGVMAVAPGTGVPVVVNALYDQQTDFTAALDNPSGGWVWNLVVNTLPGDNDKPNAIHFSVSSLYGWSVSGVDSYATGTRGHMQGDQGQLQNPYQMTVNGGAGGYVDFTGTPGVPVVVKSGGSLNVPQPWDESLRQVVLSNDLASHTGYHTQLTFTCSAPF
jgi:hypothetical protein